MDAVRAQEIVMIPDMVHVTYQGQKVFIEHVDEDQELATIHPLDNPEEKISVSVDQLVEH
ncbi:H-type small acid-soluble spore protein [Amphibacillus xylanus]|uniref:Small, acid-soluble spore protein H n=1 Tax=Amphibacillus xylanus (strain ATCC 51415 / DSM 6626 / JCM 7361 / LMG 17667 / NBRC 15112 / Ep01) TaxID=698758 RepID=K0IXG0_AMPXN|nr:H-type small acid-soluble spore protein [Amphibacillus xylanus]BAM47120.1 small acid-soluble spore protein H [Amphibacillus xylanus NBRC 15112]